MRKEPMTEREFDLLLETSLPETPPKEVVNWVNPWRRALDQILVGFALKGITLHFLLLQYILPAIGTVLLFLGFRSLRKENPWFRVCYGIAMFNLAQTMVVLIANGTIYNGAVSDFLLGYTIPLLGLNLVQYLCFWLGFRTVRKKAGLEPGAASAFLLFLWNAVICWLALQEVGNMPLLLAGGFLVLYLCILRCLWTLSTQLDEAGYAVQAAPVRVEDHLLAKILAGVLVVGLAVGYAFFDSYPMEWTPAVETGQHQAIRDHLVELGMPAQVAEDLTAEDLLACEGATEVLVDQRTHPLREGGTTEVGSGQEELQITGVALRLEEDTWKIIHHFQWVVDPGFRGTEALQFWPAYRQGQGWAQAGDWTGQLLYDRDGQTYTAPCYRFGAETYTSQDWFMGEYTATDVFAEFSLPEEGENHRGYAAYDIKELREGWAVDSWSNYYHQTSKIQYPVQTAKEGRGDWSGRVVRDIQDALQFSVIEGTAELW